MNITRHAHEADCATSSQDLTTSYRPNERVAKLARMQH